MHKIKNKFVGHAWKCICKCTSICKCKCTGICIHICMCLHVCVCTYVRMHACACVDDCLHWRNYSTWICHKYRQIGKQIYIYIHTEIIYIYMIYIIEIKKGTVHIGTLPGREFCLSLLTETPFASNPATCIASSCCPVKFVAAKPRSIS